MSLVSFIVVLILIMDPVGNAATFIAILSRVEEGRRRWVVLREMLIALAILAIFLVGGRYLLEAMHISAPALSIAGGIVLFLIAVRMIFPGHGSLIGDEDGDDEPLIVPLAVPLIAGPSAMAIVVLTATREPDRMGEWLLGLALAWGVTAALLLLAPAVARLLKDRGQRAVTRLMGMILTAMAVQMTLDGFAQYWKGLG